MSGPRRPPKHNKGHPRGTRGGGSGSGGRSPKGGRRGLGRLLGDEPTLVYGVHAVDGLLQRDPGRLRQLWLLDEPGNRRLQALADSAAAAGVPVKLLDRDGIDRMAPDDVVHQGVLAHCEPVPPASETELELRWPSLGPQPLLLVLDGVLDPRNLGACLRSADAAGVDAVLLPRSRTAPLSAAARKTACGAAESLFIVEVANLARRLAWLQEQGVRILGAAGEGAVPYTEANYRGPTALVVGGEAQGLRQLTRKHCDALVAIPMAGLVDSLNLSVATGVLLFEAIRQRHYEVEQ
jgi:23S rRNA (guanosine2251-2'-O)-methyltransferase